MQMGLGGVRHGAHACPKPSAAAAALQRGASDGGGSVARCARVCIPPVQQTQRGCSERTRDLGLLP